MSEEAGGSGVDQRRHAQGPSRREFLIGTVATGSAIAGLGGRDAAEGAERAKAKEGPT